MILLLAAAIGGASYRLTGHLWRYAVTHGLLDLPNARSLHQQATPRGGGMSIVVTTIVGLAGLGLLGALPWRHVMGLSLAGGLVAAVGFADDHRPMRRRWRLCAHVAAAGIVSASLEAAVLLPLFGLDLGAADVVVTVLFAVWLINLTNFMDGIDGLAALEAITVCLGGLVLHAVAAPGTIGWSAPVVLAAAAGGFLVWNWPPARIFMGDGGSGFVGLMLAALSLSASSTRPSLLWGWLILLGVFIVDATVTLGRRMLRGNAIHEPHRTHAYQHAALRAGRHRPVTVAVGVINVGWLLPCGVLAASGAVPGPLALVAAYAPLIGLAWKLGAGTPDAGRPVGHPIG